MDDLVESLTRGNPTEVMVVLTSVIAALAVYQLVLVGVGSGKLRPRFLDARPAARGFAGAVSCDASWLSPEPPSSS